MAEFKLPEMGEGVVEGELVTWRVKEGDTVTEDQPLCDVMTDKATIEVPSPFAGKVSSLHAKEGEIIKIDQLLITYEGSGASPAPKKSEPQPEAPKPTPVTAASPTPTPHPAPAMAAPTNGSNGSIAAAPSTRRFAREKGVDISQVPGSGAGGRIVRDDVVRFLGGGPSIASAQGNITPAPMSTPARSFPVGGEKRVPFRGLRRKISEKMRESKDKAAHFTYVEEADATQLVRLRRAAKEIGAAQGVKVTFLPFVMKSMVAALRNYPVLNSTLDETTNELVYKHYYNIGLSIQTEDGLMAPVVKNVEHKSILELARDIQGLVERARSKKLTKQDFEGGTITLTNAGSIGGLFATPVINFPEVAILGFNKIFKKPVVKNVNGVDKIVVRDWTYFSISLDHRIVDGAIGAEYMNLFVKYIENPNLLLLESF